MEFRHLKGGAQRARKFVVCALVAAMALPAQIPSAIAASHPLSAVADAGTIDYVLNVDWDYDNPPTQVGNPGQRLDRAYIQGVVRVFAQSLFTMTEGRHRVGNVFIYRNKKFGSNVDIQLINANGRSSAHVAGWGRSGMSSFNHLGYESNPESIDALGKVVAHELGHYTYGLFDEYVEAGKPLNPDDPGGPSQSDSPKSTIMNNHLEFVSLSTPADYADPAQRQTAQARMMALGTDLSRGSAWETLTRPAEQDPRNNGRTSFEAFRNVDPSQLKLTQPVDGFDARLNLVFAPEPVFRDVLVIDRTLEAGRFNDLIQAAKAAISQASGDSEFAVVASPAPGTGPVLGHTAATEDGKKALIAALDGLQPTTGEFNALAAFTDAFRLVAAVRKAGDPSSIHLLTAAEATVPEEAASTARTARISVNPLGLTGGTADQKSARRKSALKQSTASTVISLAQLAAQTGGSYNSAKDGAEAAKDAVHAMKDAHAVAYATLSLDGAYPLVANETFESSFRVASGATDGTVAVEVVFDPADAALLQFSLTAPDGKTYASTALPAGISFSLEAQEGFAEFVIEPSLAARAGQWTLAVRSSGAMRDGLGVEVYSDAAVALKAGVDGGQAHAARAPVLRVRLGGEKSIKGATLKADIYREDGSLALEGLPLRDDGVGSDARAGDGDYVAELGGKLPAGNYFALVTAQTNATSRIASLGALVKGARAEEAAVEVLERATEVAFTLEASAAGVNNGSVATPTAGASEGSAGGGGGCTATTDGRDAGMLLLLLAGLAGAVLRRRSVVRDPR